MTHLVMRVDERRGWLGVVVQAGANPASGESKEYGMVKNGRAFFFILAGLATVALACNMPGLREPEAQSPGYIYTAAAQTLQAQFTQVSLPPATYVGQPLGTTTPLPPVSATASPAPAETATAAALVSPTASACNQASFVRDITYPDDSFVQPGVAFVKVWRLRNSGSCAWDSSYQVVFSGGDALATAEMFAFTSAPVLPGETVDIQATLQAPSQAGTYRVEFLLRDGEGGTFGLGAGNRSFWAQVQVTAGAATRLDFIAQASSAQWASGAGDSSAPLAFGGADDNPAGVAQIKDAIVLENGLTSGKILLTHPQRTQNGFISGVFPSYSVAPGDQF
ncbi:MAG TPA: NBR1-Ig-like domain-containing protein, partial [Anaerolineales bacterium]|nr:NBR1-Ig-like domain-containing protein [Anaerolineales bacterium]